MSIRHYLTTAPFYNIVKYDKQASLLDECVSFIGAPRKHPYDKDKLLLINEPFSSNTVFYEFVISDILHAEDYPSIATDSGENLVMARIWVKKGSLGLKYQPFEVESPLRFMKDSELLHQVIGDKEQKL